MADRSKLKNDFVRHTPQTVLSAITVNEQLYIGTPRRSSLKAPINRYVEMEFHVLRIDNDEVFFSCL